MDKLSADYLTQLNFNRSKKWASFLKDIGGTQTADEIINFAKDEHERAFDDDADEESDDNDDLVCMEDGEGETKDNFISPAVLEDITNCSRMIMNGKCVNELTMRADNDVLNDSAKKELVDLLNHTIPIINEYKRQMKETGLEDVLNTFDSKKIAETEGDWHKNKTITATQNIENIEHNNDYKRNQIVLANGRGRSVNGDIKEESNSKYYKDEFSSDESLHSCDLARYVRSTKHYTPQFNSLSKIKTFCTVKGKRDELCQKYACHADYDSDEIYLRAIRHRRNCFTFNDVHHDYYNRHYNRHRHCLRQSNDCNVNKMKTRKKVFRKRPSMPHRNFNDPINDTESDEDNICSRHNECIKACHCRHYDNNSDNKKLMKRTCGRYAEKQQFTRTLVYEKMKNDKKVIRKSYRKYQRCSSSMLLSSSFSSSPSFENHTCKEKISTKLCKEFLSDPRTCKRESECQCYNNGKLCSTYKHLAETSNEEWFVENYFAINEMPPPPIAASPSIKTRPPLANSTAIAHGAAKEKPITTAAVTTTTATVVTKQQSADQSTTGKTVQSRKNVNIQNKKILSTKHKQQQQQQEGRESEFEVNLQIAIKESLKSVNEKQNSKLHSFQQASSETATTTPPTPTTPASAFRQNDSKNTSNQSRSRIKRHNNHKEHESQNNDADVDTDVHAENEILKKIPKLQVTNAEHSRTNGSTGKEKYNKQNSNLKVNNLNDNEDKNYAEDTNQENVISHRSDGKKNKENPSAKWFIKMENLSDKNGEADPEAKANEAETISFHFYSSGIYNSTASITATKFNGEPKVKAKANAFSLSLTKTQLSGILKEEQFDVENKSAKKINIEDKNYAINYKDKLRSTTMINKSSQKKDCCSTTLVISSTSSSNSTLQYSKLTSFEKHYNNNNANDYDNDADDEEMVSSTFQTDSIERVAAAAITTTDGTACELGSINKENNRKWVKVKGRNKGIVIYSPANKDQVTSNGYFEVTKDYLSTIIGMEAAKKFFKYYVGRRRFHHTSTVYFQPSLTNIISSQSRKAPNKTNQNDDYGDSDGDFTEDSSDDDDDNDALECCNKYGYLYESILSDDGIDTG